MEKLLLKPEEVAAAIGVGRSKIYQLLADGSLPSVRVGKALRVPADALKEWVDAMSPQPKVGVRKDG